MNPPMPQQAGGPGSGILVSVDVLGEVIASLRARIDQLEEQNRMLSAMLAERTMEPTP